MAIPALLLPGGHSRLAIAAAAAPENALVRLRQVAQLYTLAA